MELPYSGEKLAGVDEVGRGPLVGNVVAAAVILPSNHTISGLNDSKKLSAKKRDSIAESIKTQAVSWAIGECTPKEIDELNILQATLLAMKRAVDALQHPPEFVVVDGNKLPDWSYPSMAIVKGDSQIEAISAASIIAKVYRDKQMDALHQANPLYGFDKHKGYPTKAHLEALQTLGPLPCYRFSFGPLKRLA